MALAHNPFRGVSKAPMKKRAAVYIGPGKHLLEISECKQVKTRKNRELFVVEFIVISSSDEALIEGARISWAIAFDNDYFEQDVKAFMLAAFNITEDELDDDLIASTITKAQPLRGTNILCDATSKTNKAGTGQYTVVDWEFVSEAA